MFDSGTNFSFHGIASGVILSILWTPTAASAASLLYNLTPLVPINGAQSSVAHGINNLGQSVGYSFCSATGISTATLWNETGTATALAPIAGRTDTHSSANDINDRGVVVGTSYSLNDVFAPGGVTRFTVSATRWLPDGSATELFPLPRSYQSRGWAVNGNGDAVGSSWSGRDTATKWLSTGEVENLGSGLGSGYELYDNNTFAFGINDLGFTVGAAESIAVRWDPDNQAVGLGSLFDYSHGRGINEKNFVVGASSNTSFLQVATFWGPDGKAYDLGALAGTNWSDAFAVNEEGNVVGYSSIGGVSLSSKATLWSNVSVVAGELQIGSIVDLGASLNDSGEGWVLFRANDINDHGQIVGQAYDRTGKAVGFLLSPIEADVAPVPLPGSVASLALAIGGLCCLRQRRRTKAM